MPNSGLPYALRSIPRGRWHDYSAVLLGLEHAVTDLRAYPGEKPPGEQEHELVLIAQHLETIARGDAHRV